jgi:hypothetical protein
MSLMIALMSAIGLTPTYANSENLSILSLDELLDLEVVSVAKSALRAY